MNQALQLKFNESKTAYEKYSDTYNIGRKSSEQLKSAHYEVFLDLLRQFRTQLIVMNKNFQGAEIKPTIDPDRIVLFTNRVRTGKRLKKSPSTVARAINRLIEAKALLEKVNHGTRSDFELVFNPDLCGLFDINRNEWLHKGEFFKNQLRANCQPPTGKKIKEDTINNILTEVKAEKSENVIVKSENKNLATKNIPEQQQPENTKSDFEFNYEKNKVKNDIEKNDAALINKENKQIQTEKRNSPPVPAAPPQSKKIIKNTLEYLRFMYAQMLYLFAIEKIPGWKEHVFPEVQDRVVEYIEEHYFGKIQKESDFDKTIEKYKWMINKSRRMILKKIANNEYTHGYYTVMPDTYFDTQYNSGFRAIEKYYHENKKHKLKRKLNTDRLNVNKMMNNVLKSYFDDRSKVNYQKCLNYVRKNIPSRENQFLYCAKNNIYQLQDYF